MMNSNIKKQYALIAALKRVDACLQALCFVFVALGAIWDKGALLPGVCIIAGVHIFSAAFWLITLYHIPGKMPVALSVRLASILVPLLLFLVLMDNSDAMVIAVAYFVAVAGPVCFIAYFCITIAEACYYKKLARNRG